LNRWQLKKPAPSADRLSSTTHGSGHGLAHLTDVFDGRNSLPLGIPGAAGESSVNKRNPTSQAGRFLAVSLGVDARTDLRPIFTSPVARSF